jgi:hypothetical protein
VPEDDQGIAAVLAVAAQILHRDDDYWSVVPLPGLKSVNPSALLLALGCAAVALYNLVPAAGLQSVIYEGLGTIAVVSVAVRARRCSGRARTGFALVALALGCWVAGDVLSDVMRFTSGDGLIPYPSVADVMYVVGYALVLTGGATLARVSFGRLPVLPLVDGAIAAATFLAVAWGAISVSGVSAGSTAATVGALLYPTLDVLVLAAGVRMFQSVWKRAPLLVIGAGLLAMLVADSGYAVSAMSYQIGGALDSGWLVGYLCFAIAALTPSTTLTRAEPEELRFRPGRLAVVGLALVATNAASALGAYAVSTDAELIVTAICSVGLAGLVIARMAVVFRAHDRARVREAQARADAVRAQHEAEAARRELAAEHGRLLESDQRSASGRSSSTPGSRWSW